MPHHFTKAIANEFLRLHGAPFAPAQMQLQKLVYIANGWNLAINDAPLVNEVPEAWDGGPVFRSIWDHIRDHGLNRDTCLMEHPRTKEPYQTQLSDAERAVIRHVWNRYQKYSGRELSQMTHQPGTPWTETYLKHGRNNPIPNELVKRHYVELALAGRAD